MRGIHSVVDELRRSVFEEVARMAYEDDGEPDIAALKNKGAADFSLWKANDASQWNSLKALSLLANFVILPALILILMAAFFARRRK